MGRHRGLRQPEMLGQLDDAVLTEQQVAQDREA
jgi:hypothetical protein